MAAVSLCSGSASYADIGTDHGFIPIYLAQKYENSKIYAADLRRGPLESAMRNAERYGVSERIEFFCADGLNFPNSSQAETVIIAGMGGETIINILGKAGRSIEASEIIVQPQSKIEELVEYMLKRNFSILDAKLADERERIYLIIKFGFARTGRSFKTYEEALQNKSDPLLERWLRLQKEKAEKIAEMQKMSRLKGAYE